MGFVKEFKEFAVKGNVIDLAVGVIIGGAFGKIVDSVIKDLIMPLIAGIIGSPDFSNLYLPLRSDIPKNLPLAEAQALGPVFAYGNFLTVAINFLLIALAVFLLVKFINKLKRKEEAAPAAPAAPTATETLLAEIRDELKKK
ncbi:large conductance mechanosensitive channel protein MscL [Gynurincola endophyticus]|jgi:large conductance mechanosensitive channel|uniref:large conductance mechanosensitive channel protein MscL n=1 Tax=Gynurincola endophyticus TaxID=2479004 RepID=UPI000F8E1E06|nr:large conductance mechanosensitive channel protein MscL [Gynurincola endophyticus]